jgi:hypothetical protein
MGNVTVGTGMRTLSIGPAFDNISTSTTYPLVVDIGNDGGATDALVTVRPAGFGRDTEYRYAVRLNAHGQSRFMAYPSLAGMENSGNNSVVVALTAPGRHQTLELGVPPVLYGDNSVAYVGRRFGVLSPRLIHGGNRPIRSPMNQVSFNTAYVIPEAAPDRAIGYSSIKTVVLSSEAALLNTAQWQALQQWVEAGGSLILTDKALLQVPEARRLSPVIDGGANGSGNKYTAISENVVRTTVLTHAPGVEQGDVFWQRRGNGRVLFTDFDPVSYELRGWDDYSLFWANLIHDANSSIYGDLLEQFRSAFVEMPHDTTDGGAGVDYERVWQSSRAVGQTDDPFVLGLPPLRDVVNVFLCYFVLVVPVTFFVLKHTRRLNLAWVTGPVLAVAFGGGIFLLTARLYFMPMARRTTGILSITSGKKTGRFIGYTELFLPHANRYTMSLEGAERMGFGTLPTGKQQSLSTQENRERTQMVASFDSGNLAFRRLHHEQRVTLSGAISAEMQSDGQGGYTGYVDNETGKPIEDAAFLLSTRERTTQPKVNSVIKIFFYRCGTLAPGRTQIHAPAKGASSMGAAYSVFTSDCLGYLNASLWPKGLTLVGRISGEPFGPQVGKDFSGNQSVTVMVGLDTPEKGEAL